MFYTGDYSDASSCVNVKVFTTFFSNFNQIFLVFKIQKIEFWSEYPTVSVAMC